MRLVLNSVVSFNSHHKDSGGVAVFGVGLEMNTRPCNVTSSIFKLAAEG